MSNPLFNEPKALTVTLNLSVNPLLIIGGGATAYRVLDWVLSTNPEAKVKVVSPIISEEIKSLAWKKENVKLIKSVYMLSDLDGVRAVVATTSDEKINERIRRTVSSRNTWVTFAKDPAQSDFFLPLEVWQDQSIAS